MLLDEIIAIAIDDKQPLSVLLRKCLLLAHELKDNKLRAWANQELNGYPSADHLPEYRIVPAGARGNFSGSFGSALRNWLIPSILLEENHRHYAEVVRLTQAVSAYESAIAVGGGSSVYEWPANLVLYYQRRLYRQQYFLNSAWQVVYRNSLVELLETIRNRTLNLALELKEDLGSAADNFHDISPSKVEKIQQTIVNNIHGGTNYFASGHSNLNASASNVHFAISVGNRQELDSVLTKSGLVTEDLQGLTEAMRADGNQPLGSRVTTWITTNAHKVVAGGVKIGVSIGQELLIQWLKQYFGMT